MSESSATRPVDGAPLPVRPKKTSNPWKIWRRVRQAVQFFTFVFFVYLLFAALKDRPAFPLVDIFFRFNPLSGLAGMLAARAWIPRLTLSLVTVGLTLVVGRVWCGWICPLGTLLEWVRLSQARQRASRLSPHWKKTKQVLLVLILSAALFGNLSLLVLDPLALLTRTMVTVVLPGLNAAITATETTLYQVHFLEPAITWLENVLRGPVLPVRPLVFALNGVIAVLFGGILALNALADRFWCRNLCPLGALLGWLSRFSLLRPLVGERCKSCGVCTRACRLGAIATQPHEEVIPSECTMCLDCLATCPLKDMRLGPVPPRPALVESHSGAGITRRVALGTLVSGVAGVLLLQTELAARQHSSGLLRPPGVTDEEAFLSHCLRCAECIKVCPTASLQPSLFEGGLRGLWTPHPVMRNGYCDFGCNACGQICPSGAIPNLSLEDKRLAIIGTAVVDHNRCLPWASGVPCIVCEEMCPLPKKAITLDDVEVTAANGRNVMLQRPVVNRDLCIGCGICETRCPLEGTAAIQVYWRV